jgi:serine/threonine protein kinase/tetratricopeptide (TPR) repeat protein
MVDSNDRRHAAPETTVEIRDEAPTERRIGAYRILRELGHGGMGTVYLAARADEQYQKRVAIKTIRGLDSEEVLRHFRRERQILAALDNPNIARLFDGGSTEDGLPYFVMEYVEGQPIDAFCDEHRLSLQERLQLFQGVCAAVRYAHQNLVVHRDLKPKNILVDAQGVPKLLDFGIAKLLNPEIAGDAATGTLLAMTPEYASPEQMRGQPITTATDVYSLGVVLYELLTGRRPYGRDARNSLELLKAVCEEEAERPSTAVARTERRTLPSGTVQTTTPAEASRTRGGTPEKLQRRLRGDLDNIVLMALRKEPQRRYRSVEALSEDIRRFLEGRPITARKATFWYRSTKFARRNALAVGAAATVFLLAIAFGVVTAVQSGRIARARDRANREAATSQRVSDFLVNLFNVSDPGESRGNTVTARELLDKAARDIEGRLGSEPAVKGTLLYTMGMVYEGLGLGTQALELTQEAVAQLRSATPPDETAIATALQQQAVITFHLGRHNEAEPLYREALRILEKRLGPDTPEVARALDNFGVFCQETAKYDQAESLHRRALTIFEKATGPNSRDVATVLTNLANLDNLRGDYTEAEKLQRRAIDILERVLGPDHPETISGLNNLATTCFYLEKYDAAEELFQRVLALDEKTLGADHPDVAVVLNNIANAAQIRGEFSTAEASFRRADAIFEKAGLSEHPNALAAQSNLAMVYRDTGRYAEAESLQRRVLNTDRRTLGPDHPNVAFDLHRLASILIERGRPSEAEPLQRQAVAIIEHALGADHPTFAVALMVLGDVCRAEGKRAEAVGLYSRAMRISEKALGPDNGDVAELRLRVAGIDEETGRNAEAAPLLAPVLEAYAKAASRGDVTLAERVRQATALLLLGRDAEARPVAASVFATGYRRRSFVELCAQHGIALQTRGGA